MDYKIHRWVVAKYEDKHPEGRVELLSLWTEKEAIEKTTERSDLCYYPVFIKTKNMEEE
jgi:hypothetical protein